MVSIVLSTLSLTLAFCHAFYVASLLIQNPVFTRSFVPSLPCWSRKLHSVYYLHQRNLTKTFKWSILTSHIERFPEQACSSHVQIFLRDFHLFLYMSNQQSIEVFSSIICIWYILSQDSWQCTNRDRVTVHVSFPFSVYNIYRRRHTGVCGGSNHLKANTRISCENHECSYSISVLHFKSDNSWQCYHVTAGNG